MLLLRITAIAAKVRRYQRRVDSYRLFEKRRLFENKQREFYKELDQKEGCDDDQTVTKEST